MKTNASKMTPESALGAVRKGFHCSQVVMTHIAEVLGLDTDSCLKMTTGLGGGFFSGEVCGCVSSAICGISAEHGYCQPDSSEQNAICVAKVKEFERKFAEKNGSILCRELLDNLSFADPEQAKQIRESGILKRCPGYMASACEIWDEVMGVEYDD